MSDSDSVTSSQDGAWWSTWLTSAKEKSVSALSATKRDLAEFVSVLGTDTKSAISGASTNIKGILEKSSSSEKEDTPPIKSKASHRPGEVTIPYDRCQAELFALQNSLDTYTKDPTDDGFSEWSCKFDVQSHQADISSLLVSCSNVRTLHAQLVPGQVSYEAFWMRYFYKVQLMQQEESRRAGLMERAKQKEEQLKWDDDFEEIEVPSALKHIAGHQRSESSSDSFVEISSGLGAVEETGSGSGEVIEEVEEEEGGSDKPGSWELLDTEVIGGDSGENLKLLSEEAEAVAAQERVDGGGEGDQDSNSDWEKWDD